MNIKSINDSQTSFQAKVSPQFIKSMQNYINSGPNKIQNQCRLNEKIKEYAAFGYENYTVDLLYKSGTLGPEYKLIAIQDVDNSGKSYVLTKKSFNSYGKILNRFMSFNKHDFVSIMSARLNKSEKNVR